MNNNDEHDVWATVQAMNRCWTSGNMEKLKDLQDYFHAKMVAITPTDRLRVEGREACIAGWSGFARTAAIRHWTENEPKIHMYNDTAVVTYYFDMAFDIGGETVALGGRDMLTLVKEDGRWQVVADQFSPYPG